MKKKNYQKPETKVIRLHTYCLQIVSELPSSVNDPVMATYHSRATLWDEDDFDDE